MIRFLFRSVRSIIRGIFGFLTFIRTLFFNLIFLVLIVVIAAAYFSGRTDTIKGNSILTLTISGTVVEQPSRFDDFDQGLQDILGFSQPPVTLLQDILDVIDHARADKRIAAIKLDIDGLEQIGIGQARVIGRALNNFKESGKEVIAAQGYFTQNQYYLASYGSKIIMNPMGGAYIQGFGVFRTYFKNALEKLKINFHVFAIGTYKSAADPLIRNSMSAPDKKQTRQWLNFLWDGYVEDVADNRGITAHRFLSYINDIPTNLARVDGDMARLALEYGLVDELAFQSEVDELLRSITGQQFTEKLRTVSTYRYLSTIDRSFTATGEEDNVIGLIVAEGTIVPGASEEQTIGDETMVKLIRQATDNDAIKALVVRINSGGGSAFASEQIRRELSKLQASGKPVIISMGSIAASGAYWLAASSDQIWASADTLTGSIGIFMVLPTIDQALNDLGISRDGIGTTDFTAAFDITQPLSDRTQDAIQLSLEHGYSTFITIVAEGRGLERSRVEELAQGRIYTGAAALDVGLVDHLGDLTDAIGAAAEVADLAHYQVRYLDEQRSLRQRFMNFMQGSATALAASLHIRMPAWIEAVADSPEITMMMYFDDPRGLYAHWMLNVAQ
jgi:protease-4